jgi:hypothetical protein
MNPFTVQGRHNRRERRSNSLGSEVHSSYSFGMLASTKEPDVMAPGRVDHAAGYRISWNISASLVRMTPNNA